MKGSTTVLNTKAVLGFKTSKFASKISLVLTLMPETLRDSAEGMYLTISSISV